MIEAMTLDDVVAKADTSVRLGDLDPEWHATVTEHYSYVEGVRCVEGTILYIPGVPFADAVYKAKPYEYC